MITLFVAGLPLVFLEMAFGQFASEGVITIWKILPIFKGYHLLIFLFTYHLVVDIYRASEDKISA